MSWHWGVPLTLRLVIPRQPQGAVKAYSTHVIRKVLFALSCKTLDWQDSISILVGTAEVPPQPPLVSHDIPVLQRPEEER